MESMLVRVQERAVDLEGQRALPLVITPRQPDAGWRSELPELVHRIEQQLPQVGGVLLRGFDFSDETDFEAFARSFGHELLTYDYASTPRTRLNSRVYTSTEYPAHQVIPLHNEQSYSLGWPMKIWFHCITASPVGGETPIADSREVFQRLDPAIRQRFADKRLMYVRNYGNGLDLTWQQAFSTDDRDQVERYCRASQIDFQWDEEGELSTPARCARRSLNTRSVASGSGSTRPTCSISPTWRLRYAKPWCRSSASRGCQDRKSVGEVLEQCQVTFAWQAGDVLMLDNMLVAHGRSTFQGPRKVVVAMAEPFAGQ